MYVRLSLTVSEYLMAYFADNINHNVYSLDALMQTCMITSFHLQL